MSDVIGHADIQAIMVGLFNANSKLDEIPRYLLDDDDGEEEETDSA